MLFTNAVLYLSGQDVPGRHGVCELRRRKILVLQTRELEWQVIVELTCFMLCICPFTLMH